MDTLVQIGSWDQDHCPQNELAILMMYRFLQKHEGLVEKNSHKASKTALI